MVKVVWFKQIGSRCDLGIGFGIKWEKLGVLGRVDCQGVPQASNYTTMPRRQLHAFLSVKDLNLIKHVRLHAM
jgi:hypothetical protein